MTPVREITGPAGRLEAILEEPPSVRAAVVFGHPHPQYGGTMHTKVVYQGAKAFASFCMRELMSASMSLRRWS